MEVKYFKTFIGVEEIQSLERVLKSGWLTSGKEVEAFEREFAEVDGAKYAIAVSSATAGLHISCLLSKNRTCFVPNYTYLSTFLAPVWAGKMVLLLESETDGYNIDCNNLPGQSCDIIPVHIAGTLCDMDKIIRDNRFVIEDCAHRMPGDDYLRGDVRIYSLYANKCMTTGEGGMITTDHKWIYDKLRRLRYMGIDRTPYGRKTVDYDSDGIGFKYNMSDIAAAMGRVQLSHRKYITARRRAIADYYMKSIKNKKIILPKDTPNDSRHLFIIRVRKFRQFGQYLKDHGIGYSKHFKPIDQFSFMGNKKNQLPLEYRKYKESFSLPIYPDLTSEEVKYICDVLNKYGVNDEKKED